MYHEYLKKNIILQTGLPVKRGASVELLTMSYRQNSNISSTLVSNKLVDNSDVVGASPVGAAPIEF